MSFGNEEELNRFMMQDLPTPVSPTITILNFWILCGFYMLGSIFGLLGLAFLDRGL